MHNFVLHEVLGRGSETQLHVVENLNKSTTRISANNVFESAASTTVWIKRGGCAFPKRNSLNIDQIC